MRLVTRKIWRAFPELDRFNDEQCVRFVRGADRWWGPRVVRLIVCPIVSFSGFVVVVWGIGSLARACKDSMPWLQEPNGDLRFGVIAGALVIAMLFAPFAGLFVRDRLLRRTIRLLIDQRGTCAMCDYSLLGLPVDEHLIVRCPECGTTREADMSMGELVIERGGSRAYRPHERFESPEARAVRIRRVKRIAVTLAVLTVGAGIAWGLVLTAKAVATQRMLAERQLAASDRQPLAKVMDLVISTYPDPEANTVFGGGVHLEMTLQQWIGNKWRSLAPPENPRWPPGPDLAAFVELVDASAKKGSKLDPVHEQAIHTLLEDMATSGQLNTLAKAVMFPLRGVVDMPELQTQGTLATVGIRPSGLTRDALLVLHRLGLAAAVYGQIVENRALALEGVEIALGATLILSHQPEPFCRIEAARTDQLTARVLLRMLEHDRSRTWLAAMEGAVNRFPMYESHTVFLRAQRMICCDWLAHLYAAGLGPATFEEEGEQIGSYVEHRDALSNGFDGLIRMSALSLTERMRQPRFEPAYMAGVDGSLRLADMAMRAVDRAIVVRRGLRLAITIERHRADHGAHPDSFEALAIDSRVRTDPYSGGEFRYARRDPDSGLGFALYSCGPDGDDDEARERSDGYLNGDVVIYPLEP